jgi:ATP-dependent DNA ligase
MVQTAGATAVPEETGALPETSPITPMEAKLVSELPDGEGWQYEPKWDGFRCLAFRDEDGVRLFAKSGKPLGRYFPDVVQLIEALPGGSFVLDGELAVPVDDQLSFDELQLRLHPAASRVQKLASAHPAIFIVFDLLAQDGRSLEDQPLRERRKALVALMGKLKSPRLELSPMTHDVMEARAWLDRTGGALDGVVAKRLDDSYIEGERAMRKVKRIRTADCVVGGFRYGTDSTEVGSLLLGLFDGEGKLNHVGFTSMIKDAERAELTAKLEKLRGGPGFTGKAPGGPSRWSTERTGAFESLAHELVVEVAYDQVTGDRFRHGTRLLRWRPDKAPRQCTMEQLEAAAAPDEIRRRIG